VGGGWEEGKVSKVGPRRPFSARNRPGGCEIKRKKGEARKKEGEEEEARICCASTFNGLFHPERHASGREKRKRELEKREEGGEGKPSFHSYTFFYLLCP